jgi:hypothetical protein
MRKSLRLVALIGGILMLAMPALAMDLGSILNNHPSDEGFQTIDVTDLSKLTADPGAHVHVYDANGPSTRESQGMIPGARPLTSADHYDVAEELPGNKSARIVFYCANQH